MDILVWFFSRRLGFSRCALRFAPILRISGQDHFLLANGAASGNSGKSPGVKSETKISGFGCLGIALTYWVVATQIFCGIFIPILGEKCSNLTINYMF